MYTLFPKAGCSVLGILISFNISENICKTSNNIWKSLDVFENLQIDWQRCLKMFEWYLVIFRKVRKIFRSAWKTSNYLKLSSEYIIYRNTCTSDDPVRSHECLHTNFGYLCCTCNLHWCFKFACALHENCSPFYS